MLLQLLATTPLLAEGVEGVEEESSLLVGGSGESLSHLLEVALADRLGGSLQSGRLALEGLVLGDSALQLDLLAALGLGVGVQADEGTDVAKRVELAGKAASVLLLTVDLGLDLVGVDDTRNISVGHDGVGKREGLLNSGGLGVGSEDLIKLLKSSLGPDDKASQMSTRSELEEVKAVDRGDVDSGDVTEGTLDAVVLGVDNEGSTAHDVAAVAHLSLSGADLLGVNRALDVEVGVVALEDGDGILGLLDGLDVLGENEGNLLELSDAVSAGNDEGGHGRGGEGGGNGDTALVEVGLAVPLAPDLVGGEHTTSTAHVAEATLSGTASSSSSNTGDTSNSTSGTPGDSGSLFTGVDGDSVGLALVLGQVLVHALDNVQTDGGGENLGKLDGTGCAIGISVIDSHHRSLGSQIGRAHV